MNGVGRPFAVLVIISALSFVCYANSFKNSFHFDDQHYVVENPFIRDLGNIPKFFESPRYSSFEAAFTAHYRPLVVSSYALNYAAGGLDPRGYHRVNLAFHVGSSCLIFLILMEMRGGSLLPAAAAGLLFAVHPFNSEVVNYITARSSVMCGFFYLLSFYCWIRFRRAEGVVPSAKGGRRIGGVLYYIASLSSFLLALLSKEVAVTLPLILWFYDVTFHEAGGNAPSKRQPLSLRRLYLPYAPLVVGGLMPYLSLRGVFYGTVLPGAFSRGIGENLLLQTKVLVHTLALLVVPSALTIDHDIVPPSGLWDPAVWGSSAILALLLILAGVFYRVGGEERVAAFFIVWFFITLLPTTLLPLNAVLQENRGYLAGVGVVAIAGMTIDRIGRWRIGGRIPISWGILLVLLAAYAAMTFQRNGVWQDDVTLWRDAVAKAPRSARSHDNLGLAYLNRYRLEEAEREFRETIRLNPRYFYAYYNLGVVHQSRHQWKEAIDAYRRSLDIEPNFFRAYYNLGLIYRDAGRWEDAIASYRRAIEIDPRLPLTYNNLGVIYYQRRNYTEAIRLFQEAIQRDPRYEKPFYNMGNVYFEMGEYSNALQAYRSAIILRPDFEKASEAIARTEAVLKGASSVSTNPRPQRRDIPRY